jgi:hypothetical protein
LAAVRRCAAGGLNAALPAARQLTPSGYDHNAPPEVLAPILAEFFSPGR